MLPPEGNKPVDETTLWNDLDRVVTGAEIEVTFTNLTSTDSGDDGQLQLMAAPSAINPLYYEVDTDFPSAGEWEILVSVDGELGRGRATFVGSVQEAPLIDWRIVIGVIVLLIVAIWMGRRRSLLQGP